MLCDYLSHRNTRSLRENVIAKTLEVKGTGNNRYFRLKFWNNNKDEPYTIYGFDVFAKSMGLRAIK